ncbi:hypothetical protein Tsubulata_022199, partial [Turnera subulata]
ALNGIFVVTMSFGTPSRDFTLLFDTGSDITWINCQSCSETCNNTQHPVFDPSSSSTFSKATCVDPPTGCDEYKTKYYDGSYSIGYFANDTLTLTPNDVLPGFLFGCAQNVDGDFAGADGVLGIGQGRRNLIAQSGTEYYSTFCYCLPAAEDSPGYFSLGIQAFDSCKPDAERVIPLEVNPNQDGFTNYYVRLTAISFGQLRFEIPSTQKTIIDTGTSISRLPASVYKEIRSAFRQLLAQYPLASPINPIDTCYTNEGDISWTTPQVVLHFGSVEVNLDQSAVFSRESDSRLCLAFAESSDPTHPAIIGNQQHRELRVFYDIDDAKISFGSDRGQKLQRHGTRLSRGADQELPMTYYKSPLDEELRARSLKAARHRLSEDSLELPLKVVDGNFVVTVGFGTPSRDFTLLFDTGSDLTWIKCQSCSDQTCNNTQDPVFDPSSSSTFSNATCVDSPSGCGYRVDYNDDSNSIGYYANDTLALTPNDVLPGFLFGCAQKIDGYFAVDGLLGVGQGKHSLIAQSDTKYYSTFCYCLPAAEDSPGYFSLGIQAFDSCQPDTNRMIPLEVNKNQDGLTDFYIGLTAISFGQLRLEIPTSQKTIIDSGTIISRLPPSVYTAISSAFRLLMAQYPLSTPAGVMDTCYKIEGGIISWTTPQVVLHFGSVDVNLDQSAVISRESDSRICLAFAANSDPSRPAIIGNQQHRELPVFYDIGGANINFGNGGCSI